jgi:hypothetical protein
MNIKNVCWSLCQNGIEVKLMWILSHVGLVGNEMVDERARQAALEVSIFDRPLSPSDFQSLARLALMRAWQAKWGSADFSSALVCAVSKVLSGHCSVRSDLGRFRIIKDLMCVYRLCGSGPLDLAL